MSEANEALLRLANPFFFRKIKYPKRSKLTDGSTSSASARGHRAHFQSVVMEDEDNSDPSGVSNPLEEADDEATVAALETSFFRLLGDALVPLVGNFASVFELSFPVDGVRISGVGLISFLYSLFPLKAQV